MRSSQDYNEIFEKAREKVWKSGILWEDDVKWMLMKQQVTGCFQLLVES